MVTPAAQPMSARLTDVSVIETMVTKFSGDDHYDVKKWFSDFEDACVLLQFDDRLRFVACRRMLDGTARVFIRTIVVTSYEELKQALTSEFGRQFTQQEVYALLKKRKMKSNETIHRYVLEMQEIASRVTIPEEELVEIIVCGVRDNGGVFNLLWSATTISELKRLAERCERIESRKVVANVSQMATTHRSVVNFAVPKVNTDVKKPPVQPADNNAAVRCFNCSQFGHYKGQCPKPVRPDGSCFKCGELTHRYRDCPRRQMAQTAANVTFGDLNDMDEALDSVQTVSVAFGLKCSRNSELMKCVSLLDSGSP